MREALVSFTLQDVYAMHNNLPALDTPFKKQMRIDSLLWKKSMIRASEFLQNNLHQSNPLVIEMIKIWHRNFGYVCVRQIVSKLYKFIIVFR